jgi:regulator of RNase E activity RraB
VGDIQPHLTSNVEQFSQRIKMRDDVDRPREVEHFANFAAIKEAHGAARELEQLGYTVKVTRRMLFRGQLRATRQSTVDIETADAMVEEVFGVVESNRGDYDGWAAPVIHH